MDARNRVTSNPFQPARRSRCFAHVGLCGAAGSGKTKGALYLAFGLAPHGRIAVVDTENRSASLYAHLGPFDTMPLDPPYSPEKYIEAIHQAEAWGYDVVILDSISHAWAGEGGLLEQVDKKTAARGGGEKSKFFAWRDVTPLHNQFIDAIIHAKLHVICTMRSKTRYLVAEVDGKQTPTKAGMEPVVREGMDYEFDLVFDIEASKHVATASKDRTEIFDGFCDKLSPEAGAKLLAWLNEGDAPAPPPRQEESGKEEPPVKSEIQPSTPKREGHYARLRAALQVLHGEDREAKMTTIERESAVPAKGRYDALPGVRDYRELSDKRLEILVHRIEELAKRPDPDQVPDFCSVCHGPLDRDGSCPAHTPERIEAQFAEFEQLLAHQPDWSRWQAYEDFAAQDEGKLREQELTATLQGLKAQLSIFDPKRVQELVARHAPRQAA